MKKFLFIALCAIAVAFTAVSCSKNGTEVTLDSSWKQLVAKYPYLGEFPEYTGEIKVPTYNKREATVDFGSNESVGFIDKVAESVALEYYDKLEKAGFTSDTDAVKGMYSKVKGENKYQFIGTWSAGSFGLMFTVTGPKKK